MGEPDFRVSDVSKFGTLEASIRDHLMTGKRVYLRPLEDSDVSDDYIGWLNDPEVTRYMESGRSVATTATIKSYLERFQVSSTDFIFAIVDFQTKLHIGNVTLNHINMSHRTVDTAIMIGRREFWNAGYALEAWSLVIEHALDHLELRKITAGAIADNIGSNKVLQRLGFIQEGIRRKQVLVEGQFLDVVEYGLFREEFFKATRDSDHNI